MKEFTKEQLEYITDTSCKYGHLMGWNTQNNCYKCSDCGFERPLEGNEKKPTLITEVN